MSLHALAGHMATKGRNGDSMLVHMTPGEVQALQALAERNGGTLTINPETGQPEANFLKKMLPMLAGLALAPLTAGTSLAFLGATPLASAMTVGGITGLATGSLSRGLMAGLGAYGGASLGAGLANMGATAVAPDALVAANASPDAIMSLTAAKDAATAAAEGFAGAGTGAAGAGTVAAGAEAAKQGLSMAANNPGSFVNAMGGTGKTLQAGLMAISPMMADQGVQTTTKMPSTGTIRRYSFDPYGQTYTSAGNYPASEYKGMAQGGIVALAAGGLTPAQQAYYDSLVSNPANNAAEQMEYVSGLNDYQALASLDATTGNAGRAGTGAGTSGYDAAQTLAEAYGIPGAITMGSGVSVQSPVVASTAAQQTPAFTNFNASQINSYIADNSLDAAGIAAAAKQFNVDPNAVINAQNAQETVSNVYRNVLGRDPDPVGLEYWSNQVTSGQRTGQEMYEEFLKSAQSILGQSGEKEIFRPGISLEDAVKPFAGYSSADKRNVADEWVRNTLGREVTADDKQQQWYKDATNAASMNTYDAAQDIFKQFQNYAAKTGQSTTKALADARAVLASKNLTEADVLAQTGKSLSDLVRGANLDLGLFQASQLNAPGSVFDFNSLKAKTPSIAEAVTLPGGVSGGGNTVVNDNGTITTTPNIPGRPAGGFTGMQQVKDAYTAGGGSLGYVNPAPKTMEEFEQRFNKQTGDSLDAYNYLMGKGKDGLAPRYPTQSGVGQIMRPYGEGALGMPVAEGRPTQRYIYDPATRGYKENPNYVPITYDSKGKRNVGLTSNEVLKGFQALPNKTDDTAIFDWVDENKVTLAQLATAMNISLAEAQRRKDAAAKKKKDAETPATDNMPVGGANGGLMSMAAGGYAVGGGLGALAAGGATSQYNLGGYSDGGRLLRGPGDGVSDSIPATIGDKQPARLADGEFVVPARIVSELGNGSTEAGARKLYAMMDRVQKARGKTTGKSRVAANTRAEKYLPA